MTNNLISLSLLDKKGFSFIGEGGVIHVCKGSSVIMKGVKRATLYFLQGITLSDSAVVASSEIDQEDMTKLWHMRLMHMSERGMKILAKNDIIYGYKIKDIGLFEHYVFGKLHCNKFPKVIHRTTSTIDSYISCVESLAGYLCFLSLIDDYLRMTWLFIMKYKSDAFKNFKQLVDRARCMLSNVGLTRTFWVEAVKTTWYMINCGPPSCIKLKTPYELWSRKLFDYSN